jgi:hypothetical protein
MKLLRLLYTMTRLLQSTLMWLCFYFFIQTFCSKANTFLLPLWP